MSRHLSDETLIGLLYGLDDTDGHLERCSECAERLMAMRQTRTEMTSVPLISARKLAIQRQQILERIQVPQFPWRWIPAPAALALLAAALFLFRPSSVPYVPQVAAPASTVNAEADTALFNDVYSMEQDVEPKAAAPIRGLFQETSFETSGATAGEQLR